MRLHFAKREETLIAAGERLLDLRKQAASRNYEAISDSSSAQRL
jgi:hypothetical protein